MSRSGREWTRVPSSLLLVPQNSTAGTVRTRPRISDLSAGFFLLRHDSGETLGGNYGMFSLFFRLLVLVLVPSQILDFFAKSLSERL